MQRCGGARRARRNSVRRKSDSMRRRSDVDRLRWCCDMDRLRRRGNVHCLCDMHWDLDWLGMDLRDNVGDGNLNGHFHGLRLDHRDRHRLDLGLDMRLYLCDGSVLRGCDHMG